MEILKNFGVQPVLLIAQIVNFLLILFILRRFFFGPITKVLEDRRQKIDESLKNAEEIEKKLTETEEKTAKILEDATNQAKNVIDGAKAHSQEIVANAQKEAAKTFEETVADAQNQIKSQKEEMKREIEGEIITLVAHVVKKLLGRSLKPEEKKLLTTKEIADLTKGLHD